MMQKRLRWFAQKNIRTWLYVLLAVAAVLFRMLIPYCQRVFLMPATSGLDDMLMIRGAMSITEGNWLGQYGGVAIGKNMGFSVYLALLNALKVPFLLGNTALWLVCCAVAVWALRPLLRGNLSRLVAFVFMAYMPVSYSQFTMRVYRDSLFYIVSLLFFAGVIGLGLRLAQPKASGSVWCAVAAGIGFTLAWLLREDGLVLLLFAVCGLGLIALFCIFSKQVQRRVIKLICAVLPFVFLGAGILGFSAANYSHFGVFMVSDLMSGTFSDAYGAVVAVSMAESGFVKGVPVTREALQKMYVEVPTMAQLQHQLREEGQVYNGFANRTTQEYGGSFYYALRLAADYDVITPDAVTAQNFWAQMKTEIDTAVAEGRLQSVKPSANTVPRWDSSLFIPTAAETGNSVLAVLTFDPPVCDPRPIASQGTPEEQQPIMDYVHTGVQEGFIEGTDQPYYNLLQRLVFAITDVVSWIYRIAIWPLLALALVGFGQSIGAGVKALFTQKRATLTLLISVLLLGLLFSFLVRMVVSAYMEVAAFGIGTYLLYLAGGVPPLFLFLLASPLFNVFRKEKQEAAQ